MTKEKEKAVSNGARAMAEKRWANVSKAKRHQLMTAAGRQGGRPKSPRRCFCGKFTMERAASRAFDCCRAAGLLKLTERLNSKT